MTDTTSLPGLCTRDHVFALPLDHTRAGGPTLDVYAREVVDPRRIGDDLPLLVFLQGGPGFGSPRPFSASGWVGRALKEYRVLLLDQRGTARSTPVSVESVAGMDAQQLADHLTHFRADSIVRDCELIRKQLSGDRPWTLLGQSYGGFCSLRYLSDAPEGLAAAIITGGLAPLEASADDIYRRTYPRVLTQNARYYARYPADERRIREVADHLGENEVSLPSGGSLSPRRLQQLGLHFGFHDGFELVHYLFEQAWNPGRRTLSDAFLRGFERSLPYDTNPIFSLLHEACYTQGSASRWAAQRIRPEFGQFDTAEGPLLFTGEMIYPWMFDEWPRLRPFKEAAEILAQRDDWPVLYDRARLAQNEVPVVAAVYDEDMYVERSFSDETAAAIKNVRTWVTNEHPHNGLRASGEKVLGRLLDMLQGFA